MITTNTFLNTGVDQTLANLENMLNVQGRVDFCIHFWKEFSNLGKDGLEFKAVNCGVIPRMTLIPIVSQQEKLATSILNEGTRKVMPSEFKYFREANHAVTDLVQRFAGHSLVHIQGYNFNVTEVKRATTLFDALMSGLPDNPDMEQVAAYFELDMPYAINRVNVPLAQSAVTAVYNSNKLSDEETKKFADLVQWVRASVTIALRMAVEPVNGRLPNAIRLINEARKFRLDGTEIWLSKQFPGFDTASRINTPQSKTTNNDVLSQLVELLSDRASAKGEGDMPSTRRYTDALPVEQRPDNWDDLPEDMKMSLTERYLNKFNNMTVQPEDSVGMTAAEMHQSQSWTNDAAVLKSGVVTEDQAAKLAAEGKPLEVSDFQKAQASAGLPDPTKSEPIEPKDTGLDALEVKGNEARGVDPVNALKSEREVKAETGKDAKGDTTPPVTPPVAEKKTCSATTATGTPCKLPAVEGSDKCAIHNKPVNGSDLVITPPETPVS